MFFKHFDFLILYRIMLYIIYYIPVEFPFTIAVHSSILQFYLSIFMLDLIWYVSIYIYFLSGYKYNKLTPSHSSVACWSRHVFLRQVINMALRTCDQRQKPANDFLFYFFFQGGQKKNITKGKADSRAGGEFILDQINQMKRVTTSD